MKQPFQIGFLTPWNHSFLPDRTPAGKALFVNREIEFQYHIDRVPDGADMVVVWGGLPENIEKLKIHLPEGRLVFITEEAHPYRQYAPSFLAQFDRVIACRDDILHPTVINTHELNTWHMNVSYDSAVNNQVVPKSKQLSIVCSDLTKLPGQKKRFAFANQLYGHFKDRIDFYGTAFQPVKDKWDALADYRYSIAIENSSLPGYFTEKLTECYLAQTVPIYYGAPDIGQYFHPGAMVGIDIDDFKQSVATIEKLLTEDPYEKMRPLVLEAKKRYLETYHIFQALNKMILEQNWLTGASPHRKSKSIRSEKYFVPHYHLKQVKNWVSRQW